MKRPFLLAALAVIVVSPMSSIAHAGCVIAADQKSINVVTDNLSSDEKNCAVKCQVDTKIGVVQISCGGNTPPLAKDYSVCAYDKPEPWYKKVISSEDSCKGAAGSPADNVVPAAPKAALAPPPGAFACRIAADGKSVDAMISNPYKNETSCQVDCHISTTEAGTTFSVSCTNTIQPGTEQAVVCSHTYDKGRLVKMVSGSGNCFNPEPAPKSSVNEKEDKEDDADINIKMPVGKPAPIPDDILKELPPDVREMLDKTNK
jgi:hypothetical protein